ncbi:MAG: metal-sulfur cluster assembly factor [Actinobacteria bacterium]|nr:MAG: metal-sulfur cluster assembly factor [Actinomycetota bacterium]
MAALLDGALGWTPCLRRNRSSTPCAPSEGPKVKVIHTLTSMGCPVGPMIQENIDQIARSMPEVEDVEVELTWDPPWSPEKMSDDAKFILGFG